MLKALKTALIGALILAAYPAFPQSNSGGGGGGASCTGSFCSLTAGTNWPTAIGANLGAGWTAALAATFAAGGVSSLQSACGLVNIGSALTGAVTTTTNVTPVSKAANYTILGTDCGSIFRVTAASVTLTLPSAATVGAGWALNGFTNTSGSTTTLTGSGTVNGASVFPITIANGAGYPGLVSDGTNWLSVPSPATTLGSITGLGTNWSTILAAATDSTWVTAVASPLGSGWTTALAAAYTPPPSATAWSGAVADSTVFFPLDPIGETIGTLPVATLNFTYCNVFTPPKTVTISGIVIDLQTVGVTASPGAHAWIVNNSFDATSHHNFPLSTSIVATDNNGPANTASPMTFTFASNVQLVRGTMYWKCFQFADTTVKPYGQLNNTTISAEVAQRGSSAAAFVQSDIGLKTSSAGTFGTFPTSTSYTSGLGWTASSSVTVPAAGASFVSIP